MERRLPPGTTIAAREVEDGLRNRQGRGRAPRRPARLTGRTRAGHERRAGPRARVLSAQAEHRGDGTLSTSLFTARAARCRSKGREREELCERRATTFPTFRRGASACGPSGRGRRAIWRRRRRAQLGKGAGPAQLASGGLVFFLTGCCVYSSWRRRGAVGQPRRRRRGRQPGFFARNIPRQIPRRYHRGRKSSCGAAASLRGVKANEQATGSRRC